MASSPTLAAMKISTRNTRRGLWVGGALLGLVAIALALVLVPRAGNGSAKPSGDGKGKGEAAVPLEFSPSEVARPVLAKMPLVIEFSGPLVAPRTAVVRAKGVLADAVSTDLVGGGPAIGTCAGAAVAVDKAVPVS